MSIEESRKFQIYNSFPRLNFTVTFNPYKYTDMDTIREGPRIFEECCKIVLNKKGCNDFTYFYVKEQHKNQRYHLHGQIMFHDRQLYQNNRFAIYDRLNGMVKKKCGVSVFKWDDGKIDDSKEYKTYLDYCCKDATYVTYIDNVGESSTLKIFKEKTENKTGGDVRPPTV